MSLLGTSPTLRVYAPTYVSTGQRFSVTLEIETPSAMEPEWLELAVVVEDGWWPRVLPSLFDEPFEPVRARLERPPIPAGISRHEAWFELPVAHPPSYESVWAYVRYRLEARLSIPWWPDAVASWPILVRRLSVEVAPRSVVAARNDIEVALESDRVAVGGVLGGRVALIGGQTESVEVEFALREVIDPQHARTYDRTIDRGRIRVIVPPGSREGVPFRMPIDRTFAPSFYGRSFLRHWELVCTTPGVLGPLDFLTRSAGVIPIEIVESAPLAALSLGLVAPSVGDTRIEGIVREVGLAAGWTVDGARLSRSFGTPQGDVHARIDWTARGTQADFDAVATLPPLGLGLRLTRAGALGMWGGDIEVGQWSFDEAYRVEAREPAQARALLAPLAATGAPFLSRVDDDTVSAELRGATSTAEALKWFVLAFERALEALCTALPGLPPPVGTSVDAQDARRIASLARGTFHPGNLAIRGTIEDRPVEIVPLFERTRVLALRVAVWQLADVTVRFDASRPADLASLPELARPLLASLPHDVSLSLERGTGTAWIAAPQSSPVRIDHARAWSLAGLLVQLSRVLSGERGAFR